MTIWQSIKTYFGYDDGTIPLTEGSTRAQVKVQSTVPSRPKSPAKPPEKATPTLRVIAPVTKQPQISLKKAQARKAKTNPKNYYRRGGNYYSSENDSLIEDLMLLYVLSELFTENDIPQYNDGNFAANENTFDVNEINEVPEDLLDIDVRSTPVVEATPEPSYTAPEPEPVRESYSSGYSDSSSSYDSGSSDSGSGDD